MHEHKLDLRISVTLTQRCGDLKSPESFNLPLRRPIPDRVGPEKDTVWAHELHQLAHDMGRHGGKRHDGRGPRGTDFGINIRERGDQLRIFGGPTYVGHVTAQFSGADLLQRFVSVMDIRR